MQTGTRPKRRIAVLFGGRSPEHDVSILSATNVMRALDPAAYDAVPVFVTREGAWRLARFDGSALETPVAGTQIALIPGGGGRLVAIDEAASGDRTYRDLPAIDLLFPVLHGLHGEDGSIQGLAEVARVPLVGCGMTGSVTVIDKDLAKRLLRDAGLPVARALVIRSGDTPSFPDVQRTLGLPLFVKPARQGSSFGVSKVTCESEYEAALAEGFRHDIKLLAEEFVEGREIECAVLQRPDGELFVSRPGEIAPAASHGFYSFEAKYIDADGAAVIVPAQLPAEVEDALRAMSAAAFEATGCDAMARVDFFLKPDMSVVINELNTIPGFTDISMYAKAMAASGVSYPQVLDALVDHALARGGR
ncbi:D-alanine--D-alanine ligase family protein [Ancylobacter pratisalsi]|uniref:D-alanine--D-alanine ligase n=1 Tax=Ancylobacter pratisalsi TaxID=1745854 RepID=A0A6P1YME7_9HYPH|nr:D-alanine--D-alanine ligase family protein [Ancylobacter pratisalsi]QIB33403.1 D-alanine--D-alanine ligase [Ancylobacter pratisalsi]